MSFKLNMSEYKNVARTIFKAGFPVLVRGRHGIGKSESIKQLADEMGLPVVELRASQMTEGDLVGLPFKGDEFTTHDGRSIGSTEFNPPAWYLRACQEPVVLFFDEVDRAIQEVKQGLFQVTDSRCLNGWELHPGTKVAAAINGGPTGPNYLVNEMDPAEQDRYSVIDLDPTVEEWISFARDIKVIPEITSFIEEYSTALEHNQESAFDSSQVYPSRRSWVRLSDAIKVCDFYDGTEIKEENLVYVKFLAATFVGEQQANNFYGHMKEYERVVSPDDVIADFDPESVEKLNDFTESEWSDFIDQCGTLGYFSPETIMNMNAEFFLAFMTKVPLELALQEVLPAMCKNSFENEKASKYLEKMLQVEKGTPESEGGGEWIEQYLEPGPAGGRWQNPFLDKLRTHIFENEDFDESSIIRKSEDEDSDDDA